MERFKIALLITGLSFISSMSFAAQNVKEDKVEIIDNFDTGLVTNVSGNKQAKSSTPNVRNFYIDKKIGSLVKGAGTIAVGSTFTLTDIRGGIAFYHDDGSKEFLVTDSSQVLSTTDFRTYRLVVGGLNKNYSVRMKQIEGKIWITNGFNTVNVYTSTAGVYPLSFVPKGRDIEYNPDGRVWMYSTPDDASALYFSLNVSTDGTLIAPTDPRAWPNTTNLVYVGRGDGDQGTFIRNLGGILIAGKESSIHRIDGNSPTSYLPVLVSKNGGIISAESVIETDDSLYGQGRDGFYEINASGARRITDHIKPNIDEIRTDSLKVGQINWDSQGDFSSKGSFYGATCSVSGFTSISLTYPLSILQPTATPYNSISFSQGGSSSTAFVRFSTETAMPPGNYYGFIDEIKLFALKVSGPPSTIFITVKNMDTNEVAVGTVTTSGGLIASTVTLSNRLYISRDQIVGNAVTGSSLAFRIECSTQGGSDPAIVPALYDPRVISAGTTYYGNAEILLKNSTAQYISEISTISQIVAWDRFDAVSNTNGGSVNYFFKTATSAVNIATYPYIPITPGAVINSSPSNMFIQWASTLTALSTTTTSNVDSVSINYLQGIAANTRSFGTKWDGRWWIGVSTESTGNFPLIYVKAKATNSYKDAFTQFDGIPVRCFWKDREDVLYAGGSTWPVVMRLDYGTNYNGSPIDAVYDIPDLPLGRSFFEKTFSAWMIDVDKESGAHLLLGTSIDGGAIVEQSVSITGSGRLIRQIPQNSVNSSKGHGNTFKLRVRNNELDKSITVNALGLIYQDSPVTPLPQ